MSCESNPNIGVQGHRGCRGLLPENTLPAFQKAIELGVNTLELDLAISKDRQVVVSHEPFISRYYCLDSYGEVIPRRLDMKYNFLQMTYDSIKQFDCGSKQHPRFPDQRNFKTHKPLLGEVFKLSDSLNPNIKYNIEIKSKPDFDDLYTPKPHEFVSLVLNEVRRYGVASRCNLQSFDVRVLEEIKKQDPDMVVALLIDEKESIEDKLKELSFTPKILSPYFELLSKETVSAYQNQGFLVIPWTVNDPEDMERMIGFQVNSIITDYPDRLIALIN